MGHYVYRFTAFLAKLYQYRRVIWAMAVRDLAARYVGTVGGVVWAIVHPLATVIIYWFVFSVGFKARGPAEMPFILYFVSGLVPWLFFSEVLTSGINAVTSNAQLIKKTVFPAEILPLVHLTSASLTHLVLLVALCLMAWQYGYGPSLRTIQVIYYYAALACFAIGLSWFFGSLQVFHRDLGQGITVVLSLWFWLTPIVWSAEMMPVQYNVILRYNPAYYLIEGYRVSIFSKQIGWIDWHGALRFWIVAAPAFLLGGYVFKRLKPEFAEVL
jgi:lipopolysaccharide transport system permease protein/teichoic acid transport system permease protein